jgi:hypothetical protein
MALQLFEMCGSLQIVGIEFALDPPELFRDRASAEVADTEGPDMQFIDLAASRPRAEASR